MRSLNRFAKYLSRGLHTSQQEARIIQLGPKTKEVGVDIGCLSNLNVNDSDQKIRDEFWKVGYGLFRNAIDRDLVFKARDTILATVQSKYDIFSDADNGILESHIQLNHLPFLEGKNTITHHPDILNVLQNDRIQNIMQRLLDCDSVKTFDYKWLR